MAATLLQRGTEARAPPAPLRGCASARALPRRASPGSQSLASPSTREARCRRSRAQPDTLVAKRAQRRKLGVRRFAACAPEASQQLFERPSCATIMSPFVATACRPMSPIMSPWSSRSDAPRARALRDCVFKYSAQEPAIGRERRLRGHLGAPPPSRSRSTGHAREVVRARRGGALPGQGRGNGGGIACGFWAREVRDGGEGQTRGDGKGCATPSRLFDVPLMNKSASPPGAGGWFISSIAPSASRATLRMLPGLMRSIRAPEKARVSISATWLAID